MTHDDRNRLAAIGLGSVGLAIFLLLGATDAKASELSDSVIHATAQPYGNVTFDARPKDDTEFNKIYQEVLVKVAKEYNCKIVQTALAAICIPEKENITIVVHKDGSFSVIKG